MNSAGSWRGQNAGTGPAVTRGVAVHSSSIALWRGAFSLVVSDPRMAILETANIEDIDLMNEVRAHIVVGPDHRISGTAPNDVPPGVHEAIIGIATAPAKRFRLADLPVHDLPWDGSISLRREDIYGDDGR